MHVTQPIASAAKTASAAPVPTGVAPAGGPLGAGSLADSILGELTGLLNGDGETGTEGAAAMATAGAPSAATDLSSPILGGVARSGAAAKAGRDGKAAQPSFADALTAALTPRPGQSAASAPASSTSTAAAVPPTVADDEQDDASLAAPAPAQAAPPADPLTFMAGLAVQAQTQPAASAAVPAQQAAPADASASAATTVIRAPFAPPVLPQTQAAATAQAGAEPVTAPVSAPTTTAAQVSAQRTAPPLVQTATDSDEANPSEAAGPLDGANSTPASTRTAGAQPMPIPPQPNAQAAAATAPAEPAAPEPAPRSVDEAAPIEAAQVPAPATPLQVAALAKRPIETAQTVQTAETGQVAQVASAAQSPVQPQQPQQPPLSAGPAGRTGGKTVSVSAAAAKPGAGPAAAPSKPSGGEAAATEGGLPSFPMVEAQPAPQDSTQPLQAAPMGQAQSSSPETPRAGPETVQRLAVQIVQTAQGAASQFHLTLHPAELGGVQVKIQVGRDGAVSASMTFDSASAAADLGAQADDLKAALAQAGFDVADNGLSFNLSGGHRQAQDGADSSPWGGRAFRAAAAEANDLLTAVNEAASRLQAASGAGGLDIRI